MNSYIAFIIVHNNELFDTLLWYRYALRGGSGSELIGFILNVAVFNEASSHIHFLELFMSIKTCFVKKAEIYYFW